ncbi:MAG: PilZ domain-containing protein [Planctomycetes bacterium]|nr:PilZ domain-containing protein [Planctomycetota bacterium]
MESETGKRAARDRRRHPRFADDAQVLCIADEGGGGFHHARLTELSADGMRIVARGAFAAGSQIYAGVFLEDEREPVVLLGVVQHCDADGAEAVLGIQFLSLSDEHRTALDRLRAYLKRRHGASADASKGTPVILRVGEERWW